MHHSRPRRTMSDPEHRSLKPRLKVLVTNAMPFLGGAEKWAWKLGQGLLDRGHIVSFAVRSRSELAALLHREGLSVHELPMGGDAEPYSLLSLVRLTRLQKTDIILSTCERDFRLAGLATRIGGRGRVIPRLRSVWYPDRSHWKKTLRFQRQRFNYNFLASRIITNSVGGKQDLVEGGWVTDEKVEVVYNGVDLALYDPGRVERGRIREEFHIPRDAVVTTLTGRIAMEKGQVLFVDVGERLLRFNPKLYFMIIGNPTSQAYYEELLKKLETSPVRDHFILTGFRRDVERILADTDILVLPSIEEGLPNAVLEAMAMECPVIATEVCATGEAVEEGVTGYLIPVPVSKDLLGSRLQSLIEDRTLRESMGRKGRRKVEQRFDFEESVQNYEEVFRRVLSKKGTL